MAKVTATTEKAVAILLRKLGVETPEDALHTYLYEQADATAWFSEGALILLASVRHDPRLWPQVELRAKAVQIWPPQLRDAVDHVIKEYEAMSAVDDVLEPVLRSGPLITSMETIEPEAVTWLWWPYLPIGMLAMLDGDPGLGKSLLTMTLAAALSRGFPLPDQQGRPTLPTEPSTTLLLSAEDSLAHTIRPRLDAAGANAERIKVLTGWLNEEQEEQSFTLQHLPILHQALVEHKPRLVLIDPLQAYLGAIDMHRANETRPLMTGLVRLAETHGCSIVCVRHPSKGSAQSKAIHRGLGSVDMIGAARTALFVENYPGNGSRALLAQSKSNIGPLGRTQIFSRHDGVFQWAGVTRLSAEDIAGTGRGPDPYTVLQAFVWLEQRLQHRPPQAATVIAEDADEDGISFGTLKRAKAALGVKAQKKSDGWEWFLPNLQPMTPPPLPHASLETLGLLEPLGPLDTVPPPLPHASLETLYPQEPLETLEPLHSNQQLTTNNEQESQNEQETLEAQGAQEAQVLGARDISPEVSRVQDTCQKCRGQVVRDARGRVCIACLERQE